MTRILFATNKQCETKLRCGLSFKRTTIFNKFKIFLYAHICVFVFFMMPAIKFKGFRAEVIHVLIRVRVQTISRNLVYLQITQAEARIEFVFGCCACMSKLVTNRLPQSLCIDSHHLNSALLF